MLFIYWYCCYTVFGFVFFRISISSSWWNFKFSNNMISPSFAILQILSTSYPVHFGINWIVLPNKRFNSFATGPKERSFWGCPPGSSRWLIKIIDLALFLIQYWIVGNDAIINELSKIDPCISIGTL